MLFRKKSRFLILFSFYRKKRRLVSLRMRPPEAVEAADRAMRRRGRAAQETRRSARMEGAMQATVRFVQYQQETFMHKK